MGKIVQDIVNGYNLKTGTDIDMGSSVAYIEWYGQYIWSIRSGPGGHPHPQELEND